MNNYKLKASARIKGNRQQIVNRLALLHEKYKSRLTADVVVKDARAKKSPLHHEFNWDRDSAAHEWNLHQARNLLNHVEVILEECPDAGPVRMFVHVIDEAGGFYTSIHRVMSDPELREYTLRIAFQEFETLRRKYQSFEILTSVFAELDKAMAKSKRLKRPKRKRRSAA